MTVIHDGDGNEIADIGLSDKQRAVLETDEEIVMIYHTPQTLRSLLGEHNGSFSLRKHASRIVVNNVVGAGRIAFDGDPGSCGCVIHVNEGPHSSSVSDHWELASPDQFDDLSLRGGRRARPVETSVT